MTLQKASNNDIKALLQDVEIEDEDTAKLLQELEDLAGLEQHNNETRSQKRRTKKTTEYNHKSSCEHAKSKSSIHKHEKLRCVRMSGCIVQTRPTAAQSASCKLQLPLPPGYIPRRHLGSTMKTNSSTPQTVHSKPVLPPIQTMVTCRSNQDVPSRCDTNNPHKQSDTLLLARCDDKIPNITISRENKAIQKSVSKKTRLAPIVCCRKTASSETLVGPKDNPHKEVLTRKDVRKHKRSEPPSVARTKKPRVRKAKTLMQPDFVF